MPVRTKSQDAPKLRELVLYISGKCDLRESWGRTKLAKLLYFSDFRHYRKYGRPISETIYVCRERGPMPKRFYETLEGLIEDGSLVEITREIGDLRELRPTAVRIANLGLFDATEISTVDWVIENYGTKNARELSELSHQEPGWRLAGPEEDIPFETALLNADRLTAEELDFARKQFAVSEP